MTYTVYAGGYNQSVFGGIQECLLGDDGKLLELTAVNGVENPSFLSFAPGGRLFFCVGQQGPTAEIASFLRTGSGAHPLTRRAFPALSLCHVHCWSEKGLVGGASYGSGDVHIFRYDENGIGDAVLSVNYNTPDRESHPHCLMSSPDGRFLYLVDLGLDRLLGYAFDGSEITEQYALNLLLGDGPRQLLFHPTLPRAYLLTEYSNMVYFLDYNAQTGRLNVLDRVSSLPEGFTGESFGASLAFDEHTGRLYASNRGPNTIAVYDTLPDGMPVYRGESPCGGDWPRHIALTRDGRFLLSANERSSLLSVLPIDEHGFPGKSIENIGVRGASFAIEMAALES